ncbi:unnamed protein product [Camellia sinensis]
MPVVLLAIRLTKEMTEDEEPKKLLEIQRLSVIPPPFLTSTLEPTTETPKDVAQHKSLIHLPSPEANKADDSKDLAIIESLELMDMMAVYQEGAYERLCRWWVQAECRRLGDTDNPEVSELLRTAVRCLKERLVLFKYCAEEVANMRHNALFRRFISALTRGGPGGIPRPIEVHAHDPLRYVGDMLGWLHQVELVLALLDPDAVVDTGPTARQFSSKGLESDIGKNETDLTFVLDRIFEGVCRPFKVRVEQVLQSQPSFIISYKLSNTREYQICWGEKQPFVTHFGH